MTKTESLLREALAICQQVTNREEVSDDLLCSIYRSLELEVDLARERDEDAVDAAGGTVH